MLFMGSRNHKGKCLDSYRSISLSLSALHIKFCLHQTILKEVDGKNGRPQESIVDVHCRSTCCIFSS